MVAILVVEAHEPLVDEWPGEDFDPLYRSQAFDQSRREIGASLHNFRDPRATQRTDHGICGEAASTARPFRVPVSRLAHACDGNRRSLIGQLAIVRGSHAIASMTGVSSLPSARRGYIADRSVRCIRHDPKTSSSFEPPPRPSKPALGHVCAADPRPRRGARLGSAPKPR